MKDSVEHRRTLLNKSPEKHEEGLSPKGHTWTGLWWTFLVVGDKDFRNGPLADCVISSGCSNYGRMRSPLEKKVKFRISLHSMSSKKVS